MQINLFLFLIILCLKCADLSVDPANIFKKYCKELDGENQKIFQKIFENLEKSNSILEAKIDNLYNSQNEKNEKIFQRISVNLENSIRIIETKEANLNKTLIEEIHTILEKFSNLENSIKNLEVKEEHFKKTENTKILLNISDTLNVFNKKLEAKEEYLSKVSERFDESIKKSMEIADDESGESFLIKNHLLLYQMMKEMITRQEKSSAITASKESIDCFDLLRSGATESGFYFVYPFKCHCTKPVKVYCDMKTDGGGWTVFLQRNNNSNSVNFTRNWNSYKNGFGNEEEFWLGNEVLHALTFNRNNDLRLDLKESKGREAWAVWNSFVVYSEDEKFKFVVKDYDEKSTSYDRLAFHNGSSFSTYDADNDIHFRNCAQMFRSGWWHRDCISINPTGVYIKTVIKDLFSGYWSKTDIERRNATWLQLKIRPLDLR